MGGVLFREMKFVLSNFLSNEDLSISYDSWDDHLSFDTLINAFRFKTWPLGGAKVKSACGAKFAEFRTNISHFFKFHFLIFLAKDLTNWVLSSSDLATPEKWMTFFSNPYGLLLSSTLQKEFCWKLTSDNFYKKNLEVLMKIEGIQGKPYQYSMVNLPPTGFYVDIS